MKYVLCPDIQGKTHKGFIRGGGEGGKALPQNWAGQTARYSGGLPVLAEMEKEAKTPLSNVQDDSASASTVTLLHNCALYIELPFVSSPAFPPCCLVQTSESVGMTARPPPQAVNTPAAAGLQLSLGLSLLLRV